MPAAISLTLNEAGYVVEQSSTAINRAVDRGLIRAKLQQRGNNRLRKIGPAELRFLAIAGAVEKDLTPAARRKVYEAMRRLPPDTHRLAIGMMEFKLTAIDQRIAERLQRLGAVKALVEERAGSDPVLRGTTVSVYAIAALARGQSISEILTDFPSLTGEQIHAAVEYAKVYPKTGRPLPTRRLWSMRGDAAETGVWDVENDPEPITPRQLP